MLSHRGMYSATVSRTEAAEMDAGSGCGHIGDPSLAGAPMPRVATSRSSESIHNWIPIPAFRNPGMPVVSIVLT